MNPRQHARMMARNARARSAKRNTATPEPMPVEPSMSLADGLNALIAESARMPVEEMWKLFHTLNGSHWLWRAGKLMDYVERRGYRHDAPMSKSGRRVPIRKQIGLPPDPARIAFQDDVIAAVEVKVKSLPNKGNVPIYKSVGRRELEDVHTRAKDFVRDPMDGRERMHVTMRDPIAEPALLKWLYKMVKLLKPGRAGKCQLQWNIEALERLYGLPYMVQDFRTGPTQEHLQSHGAENSPSVAKRGKGRRPMTRVQRRSRLYHYRAMDIEGRSRKPTYMSRRALALSTYLDVRG